ncbi:phage antirepressor KilAC domain-containing protein [uncultured Cohaesibacter sp.]|uniref:phage antirepressor KilAC domain-containing protein n=1 Tax=uncultured Cohaesibacter sp. TaxID=1002546 RepID=UPI00374946A8
MVVALKSLKRTDHEVSRGKHARKLVFFRRILSWHPGSRSSSMNDLTNISPEMTMTTVEIAELCNKRHDNVMVVAKKLKSKGIITAPEIEELFTVNNGAQLKRKIFRLNKTESLNLVANLSPEFTARIIDRWQELEAKQSDPVKALQDPAQLRALLLDNVEKVIRLEAENGELKPLAASYEHLTKADGTFCITDAAKALSVRPKDLFTDLREMKWIYRRVGGAHWIGYSDKVQQGLLDHKVTEVTTSDGRSKITEQVRITAKGMAKLAEKYSSLFAAE